MTADWVCLDTETVGFTGPIVLLQWAEGLEGQVNLYSPMREPIGKTLKLIEYIISKKILGFNLSFDIWKLQQAWTTLKLLGSRIGYGEIPLDHIDEYALCEPAARDGPCLKPAGALDLMLHARKGPWQALMARDPIVVRRIHHTIAPLVRDALERKVELPEIFFSKRKKRNEPKWKIFERKDAEGNVTEWVDIVLRFAPSSGLKPLATQELGLDPNETLVYADVEISRKLFPVEHQFAPFALAVGCPGAWNGAWPDVVKLHDSHWAFNELARKYALLDVEYPRKLWVKWGCPAFDDNDSLLACKAGAMRHKGFAVDLSGIKEFRDAAAKKMASAPRAPKQVMAFLREMLAEVEQVVLTDPKTKSLTTKKVVLEEIAKMKECTACLEGKDHAECKPFLKTHKAALRAQMVLEARTAKKQVEIYDKLLLAERFHVSTNIIGTRSSRQSGGTTNEGKPGKKSGSLNPQAINKAKNIRAKFPLAFTLGLTSSDKTLTGHLEEWAKLGFPVHPELLVGGDFDKFEVCVADAYYEDPQLHEDLVGIEPPCHHGECKYSNWDKEAGEFKPVCSKCTGKAAKVGSIKIHAVIGTIVYPPRTYWEILATAGKDRDQLRELFPDWPEEHHRDLYTRAKSAFFALIYFGNEDTLAERLGIPKADGKVAYTMIMARYPVMAEKRVEFFERFCPLRQPDGIGSKVYWVNPEDSVQSMIGFSRYYTLENKVIRAIFDLADDIPPEWKSFKTKVVRRDREQTVSNAVRSALLAAAFGLQGANMRSAGNHVIQSTGGGLTKELECEIWELQPCGIHPWLVRPMNVHDELPTAIVHELEHRVAEIQSNFIKRRKSLIPLLGMKWKALGTWAGK